MTLLLATGNPGKVAEWRALAPDVEWLLRELPEPDETGATTAENALLKARAARDATGLDALGDDVGLLVPAWGGRPGVDLKPWALGLGGWEAARAALAAAAGAEATFECALALARADGTELVVVGTTAGRLRAPDGPGPGVEPCFAPEGSERSLAAMPPEARSAAHHRHRAWRELRSRGWGWSAALPGAAPTRGGAAS